MKGVRGVPPRLVAGGWEIVCRPHAAVGPSWIRGRISGWPMGVSADQKKDGPPARTGDLASNNVLTGSNSC